MPTMLIISLVFLIVLSGFFSGTETALMSLNMIKVNALVKQKRRGSQALLRLKKDPHKLIITILIGNNIVNIGAASVATVAFTEMFGSAGVGIATGVMTFLILVFGEITPKTLATQRAESISLAVARPIEILSKILYPFVVFFGLIAKGISRLAGVKDSEKLSEEELRSIVTMGRAEGLLSKEAAEMMHNVLKFQRTTVVEIMTPKSNAEMIDGNKTLKNVIDFVVKTPFSRYPVYTKNRDEIIGILDVDDVLKYAKDKKLGVKVRKVVRKAYFVPESKEIDDLLTEFEGKHVPMAIVVNEYSYVIGIVTVEDILEEIVGNIFDKSKRKSVYVRKVSNNIIKVDAKITIEEINRELHLGIRKGHFDTLGGFVEHKLRRVPKRGDKIQLKRVTLIVDNATKQGVRSLKIIRK